LNLEILSANLGNYPRPPDLRKAIDRFKRGKLTRGELLRKASECTVRIIRLQEIAGLDVITSGMLLWDDLITKFMEGLEGVELNGLLRFFDNNFYYRVPVVKGKLRWRHPLLTEEYGLAVKVARKRVKLVVPGPLTMAYLCRNEYYPKLNELIWELGNALKRELSYLKEIRADYLQFDEPILTEEELKIEHFEAYLEVIGGLVKGLPFKSIVATYFGCLNPKFLQALFDVGIYMVGLDLISCKKGLADLSRYFEGAKALSLGIVDARNTKLEDPKDLATTLAKVLKHIDVKELHLTPNTWLDYIPYERAFLKLKVLSEATKEVRRYYE